MESALIFGGIAVSLLVEWVKTRFDLSTTSTMLTVVGLSLAGGAAYFFLNLYGLWESVLQILISAGAFYAFIIRNVKTD